MLLFYAFIFSLQKKSLTFTCKAFQNNTDQIICCFFFFPILF